MAQIKRLKSADRIAAMEPFRGKYCELVIDQSYKDETYYGTVVAAGTMWSGTTADVVVLRGQNGKDFAFSGASVRTIKEVS